MASFLYSVFLSCICVLSSFATTHLLGNETDRLALLSFKSLIISDPSNIMASWNDSRHFCEWEGITCSRKHQRVSVINLSSRSLVGHISPHIRNLSFLKIINLNNNSFSSDVPQEIGSLFRLEELRVANNSLQGQIPINISLCSNLLAFDLSYNHLVGKLPVQLGSLPKLNFFSVSRNMLQGSIPPAFGNLTSLDNFDLAYNRFEGSIPHNLGKLKRLTFFDFGNNNLSGMFPPSLYNLSNLETFSIVDNFIIGTLPINIGSMLPNIRALYMGVNQFYGPLPISFFNVSKLQVIDIPANQFRGDISHNVGNLGDLQSLNLGNNDFGSGKTGDLNFIHPLTNCSNLNSFEIDGNHYGGTLPTSIVNFSKQIQVLDFSNNEISGNIPPAIENLQNLYYLNLSHNLFTGRIPKRLGNMQKLQALHLHSNQLSANVPSSMWNMSSLNWLSLSDNFLEGSISQTLQPHNLEILNISSNKFSGTIPKEIGYSFRFLKLDLSNNILNGSIPSEVGKLAHLYYFAISNNNVSGEIPETLVDCSSLQHLYLDGNSLEGSLPSTIHKLIDLRELNVSHNYLSGIIPKGLENLRVLSSLDLSSNRFEGEVPKEGIFHNKSAFSVTGNQNICGGILELNLPACPFQQSRKPGMSLSLKVILFLLILLIMMVVLLVIYLLKKSRTKTTLEECPADLWRVTYNDLHKATSGFSSANLIGTGRYGLVYKGVSRQGNLIAVKVLNLQEPEASKTFITECEALRVARHRNLLKIHTVCVGVDFSGNDFKALALQFMTNGNLDSWLHQNSVREDSTRSLNFPKRLNIAIDVATGVDYLHNHGVIPIVHCDLKASNVLLDDELTAYVADFGLAKFLPMTSTRTTINNSESSWMSIRGTTGYIPPEYGAGGMVSTQGDVYSFGILLLEMFTGKRPTDPIFKDGLNLHDLCKKMLARQVMEIIDMNLLFDIHDKYPNSTNEMEKCFRLIVRVGVGCSMDPMTERMSIREALKELHSIRRSFLPFMKV